MIKTVVNDFQKAKNEWTNEDREEVVSDSGEDGEVMSETKIKDELKMIKERFLRKY